MFHGVINIYKEQGFTSHDVVAKLRGILKQKKIGHTGTLDPAAEGVLPVCLGTGTRLCDMLTDHVKTYRAVLLLGIETDTQDTTGAIVAQRPVSDLEPRQVSEIIYGFVGPYQQIPPMYSALKVNGKKLYELAREGIEIERKSRPVEIFSLEINEMDFPRVVMTVTCSKGTYIRTLCHDIGKKLGCGGCMEHLLRTRVGMFKLDDSLKLSQVGHLVATGRISEAVMPVDQAFPDYPQFFSREEILDRLLRNGNPFPESMGPFDSSGQLIRVYDTAGLFIGVYEHEADKERWKPKKIFLGG